MSPSVVMKACFFAGFLLLSGCQATPQADQLRQQKTMTLATAKQIDTVPFVAQQQYYCGPTTLSEVFGYYRRPVSAEDIAPKIFIPEKNGSLQLEMISATRQYDFLPYSEKGNLIQLFSLIEDDIPVIVFQNLSIQLLPQWHYAVVTGYDLSNRTVTLHTGVTKDHSMSFELFEKTWGRGNYWLLAPVPVGKSSPHMDPFTYVSAAYDMLKVGRSEAGIGFLESATQQWPNEWLAYFLLANHYRDSNPVQALEWFKKGYPAGQYQSAYLNNFADLLASQGCAEKAGKLIEQALDRFPEDDAIINTQREINSDTVKSQCSVKF